MNPESFDYEISVLGNKNFLLLLWGQIVSNIGNALYSIGVVWYLMSVSDVSRVGFVMSVFSICMVLPHVLVGPIGGVFADRFDRRIIIYGTDYLRGVLFAILTLMIYMDIYPILSIFVVTVLSNALSSFFNAAVDASIPNLVHETQLNKANSYNGISRQLTLILGSALAGMLYYYIGIVGILTINTISFILSGISEMFIILERKNRGSGKSLEIFNDMKDGLVYIKSHGALLKTVIFFTLLNLIINPLYMVVFPKVVKFDLLLSAKELGIFNAIFAVGAILGMVIVSQIPVKKSYYKLITISLVAECVVFVLFAIPIMPMALERYSGMTILWVWSILGVVFAVINSLLNIPLFTILQSKIEDDYRGRVFSLIGTMAQAATPIGFVIIGLLTDRVPSWSLFMICGFLSLFISLIFLVNKDIKAYW